MSLHQQRYYDVKRNVDTMLSSKKELIPFSSKSISEFVHNDVYKEQMIYIVGIFFIVILMLIVYRPNNIMVNYINEYGIEERRYDKIKILKLSFIITTLIVICFYVYKNAR